MTCLPAHVTPVYTPVDLTRVAPRFQKTNARHFPQTLQQLQNEADSFARLDDNQSTTIFG